jgi:hypothetical protein
VARCLALELAVVARSVCGTWTLMPTFRKSLSSKAMSLCWRGIESCSPALLKYIAAKIIRGGWGAYGDCVLLSARSLESRENLNL